MMELICVSMATAEKADVLGPTTGPGGLHLAPSLRLTVAEVTWPHFPGEDGASLPGVLCQMYLLSSFVTVCFPDTWSQMCSNQEKQCLTFSIVQTCTRRPHCPL